MVRAAWVAAALIIAMGQASAADKKDVDACKSSAKDQSAVSACGRAISSGTLKGKGLAEMYYERGMKRRYNKDYDQAIADFTHTIKLTPDWTWPYVARGHTYAYKKQFASAFADQETAIKLEPTAVTYTGRAIDLIEAGAYDRAIADLNEALRLNPKYFYGYLNRGAAYLKKREFGKAEADYRKAIEISPNDQDAKNGLKRARDRTVN